MSSSPTYLDPIVIPLIQGESVLDVACGYGRWANLIRSNFWESGLQNPPKVDGFDAFEPNVKFCESQGSYRHVWYQEMPSSIQGQWDTVLACEFIEHLPQEQVEETLDILESVAQRRVIFSTPNFPAFRAGLDSLFGFNDFEAHLSYVSRKFFQKRGYKVITAGFGNPNSFIFKVARKLKCHRHLIWQSAPLFFPSLGHSIVAYKDV